MNKYCSNCGKELEKGIKFCTSCGKSVDGKISDTETINEFTSTESRSQIAAGLFGILLGSLGIHNFYLGYTSKAVTQLLLTLVGWILCGIGPLIASIWGLIEGILILTGEINEDANGNKLKK